MIDGCQGQGVDIKNSEQPLRTRRTGLGEGRRGEKRREESKG